MFIGNIVSILLNIATVKILTNRFSTNDFGIYSITMSFNTFPQLVLFAPISAAIFPFIKKHKEQNNYLGFQREIFDLFYFVVIILLAIIMMIAGLSVVIPFLRLNEIYLLLMALFFSSSISALTILDTFSLANSKIKQYVIFPIVNLFLKLLMIAVLFFVHLSPYSLILLFCLIQSFFFVFELHYLRKREIVTYRISLNISSIFNIKTEVKRNILKYSQNFVLWGAFAWLQTFLDKYLLQSYANSSTVAVYAVYYQYGFFPFTIFSSIISQYITPIYFDKYSAGIASILPFLKKLIVRTNIFLIACSFVLPVLAYYIAPFTIKILTSTDYLKFISDFPYIVLAGSFYCFSQIITVPLLGSDQVKKIKFPKIMSSVLAVIFFAILAPRYHLVGIMISLLISNAFYFITIMFANWQYYKQLKDLIYNEQQ